MYLRPINQLLAVICLLGLSPQSVVTAEDQPVIAVSGQKHTYYHMRLTLTPKNTKIISNRVGSGGQFQLLVHRNSLPVSFKADIKDQLITLSMPATQFGTAGANLYISEKKRLFENIQTMSNHKHSSISVVIEYNPYVIVENKKPLKLQLYKPEIIFRHSLGRYINYTGTLKYYDKK